MQQIDKLHTEFPFAGARMLRRLLAADGSKVGRRHVKTLMSRMGIEALYQTGVGANQIFAKSITGAPYECEGPRTTARRRYH
jgi:HTH-like domain